jgi:hypothetical protein
MDADYQRVLDQSGERISEFNNSLFVWTSIMSKTRELEAVCDAGLKVLSADSGLPVVYGRDDIEYTSISDEHGVLADPHNRLIRPATCTTGMSGFATTGSSACGRSARAAWLSERRVPSRREDYPAETRSCADPAAGTQP